MKNRITLFLILTIITRFTYGQLSVGLKANYPFSGNSTDQSGQNNNGTLIGNPLLTTDRFGMGDCAYQFPGDTLNYIKINYSTDFDIVPTGAFSISLWYQGGTPNGSDLEFLFRKIKTPKVNSWDADNYTLSLYDNNQPSFEGLWDFSTVSAPDWYHLVAIYDNQARWLYKNNSLKDANASGLPPISQSLGNITIGQYFMGKIDDIRFYNRALSVSEINQLYLMPSSCQVAGLETKFQNTTIKIFPNPTTNFITIESESTNKSNNVTVFNIYGQVVFAQILTVGKIKLDFSKYDNGLYYLNINQDGTLITKIIQKQD
jgi:hypothetical protein